MAQERNTAAKEAAAAAVEGRSEVNRFRMDHPAKGVSRIVDAEAGTVALLMPDGVTPRKKFACIGFASSTREMAPYDDPQWAIVGMNQLARREADGRITGLIPRADLWFEIHREWNTALVPGTDHKGWLAECGIPVLMVERQEGLPTSVRYPIETLIERTTDYYTSTVAYMVAYFIWHIDRLVEERMRGTATNGLATVWDVQALVKSVYAEYAIGIFGIDLIVGEEYDHQKACAEFWIGEAEARGIAVHIPPQSALCKQRYRYGYQAEPNDLIRDSDIAKRLGYLQGERSKHFEAVLQLDGAITELQYMTEFRKLRERGGTLG